MTRTTHKLTLSFASAILLAAVLVLAPPRLVRGADEPSVPDTVWVETRAAALLKGVMDGIEEGDFEQYTRDFSETMRKSATRESFLELQKNLRKKLGKYRSSEYMGFLSQEGLLVALFKAKFSKEKDDVLIKVVINPVTSPKVLGLWFDAPDLLK